MNNAMIKGREELCQGVKRTNYRWVLVGMMFLLNFLGYMDRVNLSVATPEIMREFSFSKMEIGLMHTAFFVGYAFMQIPGGMMSEWFGPRRVIAGAVTWWSVFTGLTTVCGSLPSFFAVRAAFGMGEGPLPPSMNTVVYRWMNKAEKGMAYSIILGGAFIGPVFGPAITVWLMNLAGWRGVFIGFGMAGLFFVAAWWLLSRETPRDCKYVNAAELAHIEEGVGAEVATKELAPWRVFLKSGQFWALAIQYFITDYIMFVFLAWLPVYLIEARQFSLNQMGFAAALPWAALCLTVMTAGYISDKLVAQGVPKHQARTLFGMVGLIICCITLYLGATATNSTMNVLWLTISLGSLGLTFSASWAACTDIGGRFTGSVSGWMNAWGNFGGVAAPVCTAWIATKYGWEAAIVATAFSAAIGIIAWLLVKPDRQIV